MVGMLLCQHCSETVIHICLQGVSGEGGMSSGTPNKPSLATGLQKKMARETMKRQGNWFITVLCGSQGVNMWSSVSRKYWPWPSGEVGKIWSREQKSWPVWCLSPISSCLLQGSWEPLSLKQPVWSPAWDEMISPVFGQAPCLFHELKGPVLSWVNLPARLHYSWNPNWLQEWCHLVA